MKIKKFLIRLICLFLPKKSSRKQLRDYFSRLPARRSYSQCGEDLLLESLFLLTKTDNGFYVDVGCHHPHTFSNTKIFYDKGWCGINIDALPGVAEIFNKQRERDVNLEFGVSSKAGVMDYYSFNKSAFNTFDQDVAKSLISSYENSDDKASKPFLKEIKQIQVRTLSDILDEFLPKNQEIDFFTIDVEGLDLEVLRSNDWNKYMPKVILVEIHNYDNFLDVVNSDIYKFLSPMGYVPYGKATMTYCFVRDEILKALH